MGEVILVFSMWLNCHLKEAFAAVKVNSKATWSGILYYVKICRDLCRSLFLGVDDSAIGIIHWLGRNEARV